MLIVNADDWGRSVAETDAALGCHRRGTLGSVSAMVHMRDSERAASLARAEGLDVGLHLNFTQPYDPPDRSPHLEPTQRRLMRFLRTNKFALLVYHPRLRDAFREAYDAQIVEFHRLYGQPPSHIDGHHHMHLATNMLLDEVIPRGQRVRRSFSFWAGEKSLLNRLYRRWVDAHLARRYCITDYFFALSHCRDEPGATRVFALAGTTTVEVMAHPGDDVDFQYLVSEEFQLKCQTIRTGAHADMECGVHNASRRNGQPRGQGRRVPGTRDT